MTTASSGCVNCSVSLVQENPVLAFELAPNNFYLAEFLWTLNKTIAPCTRLSAAFIFTILSTLYRFYSANHSFEWNNDGSSEWKAYGEGVDSDLREKWREGGVKGSRSQIYEGNIAWWLPKSLLFAVLAAVTIANGPVPCPGARPAPLPPCPTSAFWKDEALIMYRAPRHLR